tara:strand:+ start:121 stop:363 length:243 start_codon:yes stop_codon:yes gene_type:complete
MNLGTKRTIKLATKNKKWTSTLKVHKIAKSGEQAVLRDTDYETPHKDQWVDCRFLEALLNRGEKLEDLQVLASLERAPDA